MIKISALELWKKDNDKYLKMKKLLSTFPSAVYLFWVYIRILQELQL